MSISHSDILAVNYQQNKNETKKPNTEDFTIEYAIRSVLDEFNLNRIYIEYLTTQILSNSRKSRDENIASTNKYSNDPDIAIVEIRNHIGGLYLDGLNQQYEAIKENPISPMFKGKTLAMYFPENYLCIYSEEHIDHVISCLNIKTSNTDNILDKQLKLLSWKNDHEEINTWSNYVFAVFLYDAFGRPLSIEQDKKALQEERDKEYP